MICENNGRDCDGEGQRRSEGQNLSPPFFTHVLQPRSSSHWSRYDKTSGQHTIIDSGSPETRMSSLCAGADCEKREAEL